MNKHLPVERTVRLFRNGRSQAVRIPKDWEFDGVEVTMRREEDGTLVMAKTRRMSFAELQEWLSAQEPTPDFPGDPGYDDLLPLDDVKL